MKTLKVITLMLTTAMVFGCASKKAKDAGNDALSPAVTSDAMDLSPQGSDSGKINGLNTVHFEFDRSVIEANERDVLRANADWIKKHPDLKIQIEGHCDQRGSVEYNLALGDRRAKAVQNTLVEMGVPKSRLSTISYGEERPIANGDSEEAYAKNRRANFVPLKMGSETKPLATTSR